MSDIDGETGEIIETRAPALRQSSIIPAASSEVTAVCSALAEAQAEMEAPLRTKKGKIEGTGRSGREYSFEYAYAPLEEIIRVIKGPFAKHGLARQQYVVMRGNLWMMRTIIWHGKSGQWITSDYPIFSESMTGQKFAAACTYAKRQGLSLVAGLAPEDDTDLQEQAAAPPAQTATRTKPAVASSSTEADIARATVVRIRSEIKNAQTAHELGRIGVLSPSAERDRQVIVNQPNGDAVWADLVKRQNDRVADFFPQGGDDQ